MSPLPAWPHVMAHEPDEVRARLVHPVEHFDPDCPHTLVYAPCCGRRMPADAILDLHDVPGTVVAGGNHRPPQDHDWLCTDCMGILLADPVSGWTRPSLFAAMGAPDDVLRHELARLITDREELAHHKRMHEDAMRGVFTLKGYRPVESYQAHHASLATIPRDHPLLQRPPLQTSTGGR